MEARPAPRPVALFALPRRLSGPVRTPQTGRRRTTLIGDRTNIGNAKVAGLQEDLDITDTEYNIALTVFFISYSVFEPLTNVLLKRWGPSIFIPVIVILWVSAPYLVSLIPCICADTTRVSA